MEKITEDTIKAVVAIIIGFGAIFKFEQTLAGIILIAVGTIIAGVNPDIRNLSISFAKWIWGKITDKEQTQVMKDSPGSKQQLAKSGRDSYVVGRDLIVGPKNKKENKPKLKIYFDKNETYHNLPIVNIAPVKNGIFVHAMVKNLTKTLAQNCYGELIEVQEYKNERYSKVREFTAPVILKWAHEDIGKKLNIDNDVPRRLDICHTIDGFDHFLFMTQGGPTGVKTNFPKGEYKIKIRVKGDNTDFSYGEFLINFDGNWNNIKLT